MFPDVIDDRGKLTEAVSVVGAPEVGHIDEIGISKIGIDPVSPDVVTESALLLLVVLLAAAAAFFFLEDFLPGGLPSFPVGGGTKPAATACAFNSFCRFRACDLACFLK